jgi:hypothetical protein
MQRFLFRAAAAALLVSSIVLGTVSAKPPVPNGPAKSKKHADLTVTLPNAVKFLDPPTYNRVLVTVTNIGNRTSVPAKIRVWVTKGSPSGPVVFVAAPQTVSPLRPGQEWRGLFVIEHGYSRPGMASYFVTVIVDPAPNIEVPLYSANNKTTRPIP